MREVLDSLIMFVVVVGLYFLVCFFYFLVFGVEVFLRKVISYSIFFYLVCNYVVGGGFVFFLVIKGGGCDFCKF